MRDEFENEEDRANKHETYDPEKQKKKKRKNNTCFNCCLSILILNMVIVVGLFITGTVLGNIWLRDNVNEDLTVGQVFRVIGNINNSRRARRNLADLQIEDASASAFVDQAFGAVFLHNIDSDELLNAVEEFAADFFENDYDFEEFIEELLELISYENVDLDRVRNYSYENIEDMFMRVSGAEIQAFLNDFVLNTIVLPQAHTMIMEGLELPQAVIDAFDASELDFEDILQIQNIIFYSEDGVAGVRVSSQTNLHNLIRDVRRGLDNDSVWDSLNVDNNFLRFGLNIGMFLGHHLVLRPMLPNQLFITIDMPLSEAKTPIIRLNNTDDRDWETLLLMDEEMLGGQISNIDNMFDPDFDLDSNSGNGGDDGEGRNIGQMIQSINEIIPFIDIIQDGSGAGVPNSGRIEMDLVAALIEVNELNYGYLDEFECVCGNCNNGSGGGVRQQERLPECRQIISHHVYSTLSHLLQLDTAFVMNMRFAAFDFARWTPSFYADGRLQRMYIPEFGEIPFIDDVARPTRWDNEGFNIAQFIGGGFDVSSLSADDYAILSPLFGNPLPTRRYRIVENGQYVYRYSFDLSLLTNAQVDALLPLIQAQYEQMFIETLRIGFGLYENVTFDEVFDLLTRGDTGADEEEFWNLFCHYTFRELTLDGAFGVPMDHRMLAAIVGRLIADFDTEEFDVTTVRPRFVAISTRNERGRDRDFAQIGVEIIVENLLDSFFGGNGHEAGANGNNGNGNGYENGINIDEILIPILTSILPRSILVSIELELTLDADKNDLADMAISFGNMDRQAMDTMFMLLDRFGIEMGDIGLQEMLEDMLGNQIRNVFVEMNESLGGSLSFRPNKMIVPNVFDVLANIMNEEMDAGLEDGEDLREMLKFLIDIDDLFNHFDGLNDFDGSALDDRLQRYYAIYSDPSAEPGSSVNALFDAMQDPDNVDDILNLINVGGSYDEGLRGLASREDDSAGNPITGLDQLDLRLEDRHIAELIIAFAQNADEEDLLYRIISNDTLMAFDFFVYLEEYNGDEFLVYYVRLVVKVELADLMENDNGDSPALDFISRMLGEIYVTMTAPIQIVYNTAGREAFAGSADWSGDLTGILLNYNSALLDDADFDDDNNRAMTDRLIRFLYAVAGFCIADFENQIIDLLQENINAVMNEINENDPDEMQMWIHDDFYLIPEDTRYGTRMGSFEFRLRNLFDVAAGLISDNSEHEDGICGEYLRTAIHIIFNEEYQAPYHVDFRNFFECGIDPRGYTHYSQYYLQFAASPDPETNIDFSDEFMALLRRYYAIADYRYEFCEDGYHVYDENSERVRIPVEMDDIMDILMGEGDDDILEAEFADMIDAQRFKELVWEEFDEIMPHMNSLYMAGLVAANWDRFMHDHDAISEQDLKYVRLFGVWDQDKADYRFYITLGIALSFEDLMPAQMVFRSLLVDDNGNFIRETVMVSITVDLTFGGYHEESVLRFNGEESPEVIRLIEVIQGTDPLEFSDIEYDLRDNLEELIESLESEYEDELGFAKEVDENGNYIVHNGEYAAIMLMPNLFELMKNVVYSDYDNEADPNCGHAHRIVYARGMQAALREYYYYDVSNPDSDNTSYAHRNAVYDGFEFGVDGDIEDFITALLAAPSANFDAMEAAILLLPSIAAFDLEFSDSQLGAIMRASEGELELGQLEEMTILPAGSPAETLDERNFFFVDSAVSENRDLVSVTFSLTEVDANMFADQSKDANGRLARRMLAGRKYLSILLERDGGAFYEPVCWRINRMSESAQEMLYVLMFITRDDLDDQISDYMKEFTRDYDRLFYDGESGSGEPYGLVFAAAGTAIDALQSGIGFSIETRLYALSNAIGLGALILGLELVP